MLEQFTQNKFVPSVVWACLSHKVTPPQWPNELQVLIPSVDNRWFKPWSGQRLAPVVSLVSVYHLRPTADLTTTVVHSYKLLINKVKPDHSVTQSNSFYPVWLTDFHVQHYTKCRFSMIQTAVIYSLH